MAIVSAHEIKRLQMAKGYWITAYRKVSNPEKVAAYVKLAGPAIQAAGAGFWRAAQRSRPTKPGFWNVRC
jgi:uncharacterized protein (DUF1330 family)